jgi:hypothetical protein
MGRQTCRPVKNANYNRFPTTQKGDVMTQVPKPEVVSIDVPVLGLCVDVNMSRFCQYFPPAEALVWDITNNKFKEAYQSSWQREAVDHANRIIEVFAAATQLAEGELTEVRDRLELAQDRLESMERHQDYWRNAYAEHGDDVNGKTQALHGANCQLYELLGVSNQTEAALRIRGLMAFERDALGWLEDTKEGVSRLLDRPKYISAG